MNDFVVNGATVAVLLPMLGVMSTVIVALYRLLIGRLTRAESQVDTGLSSLEKLADNVDTVSKAVASLASDLAALRAQHAEMMTKLTSLERRRS
jgi:chromosome segregation ATPase